MESLKGDNVTAQELSLRDIPSVQEEDGHIGDVCDKAIVKPSTGIKILKVLAQVRPLMTMLCGTELVDSLHTLSVDLKSGANCETSQRRRLMRHVCYAINQRQSLANLSLVLGCPSIQCDDDLCILFQEVQRSKFLRSLGVANFRGGSGVGDLLLDLLQKKSGLRSLRFGRADLTGVNGLEEAIDH